MAQRTLADLLRADAAEREADYDREIARQEALAEWEAEQAYERRYEYDPEADAFREWEDSRGVIQFSDALDAALGR